jgi:diguanylate cyclase (GGDEF)-like protein/PAS domain S-box-containing protein
VRALPLPEDVLQLYLENSPLALIQLDANLRFVAWSERAASIFGWSDADVRGKTVDELGIVDAADRADIATLFRQLAGGPAPWKAATIRNRRRDGRLAYCRWFNARITSKRFDGYVSLVEDVTDATLAHEAASASEERVRALFEATPDALTFFDAGGVITDSNPASERLMGAPRAQLIDRPFNDFIVPDDLALARNLFGRVLGGETVSAELTVRRPDGRTFPVDIVAGPLRERGEIAGAYCSARDVTERLAHQRQIAAHAERIRDLYLSAAAANQNAERQIAATLEAGCRILALSSAALYESETDRVTATFGEPLGTALARLALGATGAVAYDDLRALPQLAVRPDGAPFLAYIGTPIDIGGVPHGTLSFADHRRQRAFDDVDRDLVQLMGALVGSAIERGRSRARLQSLAYSDAVTGLPNRAWLLERLRGLLGAARPTETPVGVLFLDLDHFKDINDTLGHDSGDYLLRVIGERLVRAIRASDVVARMGGDEFVVLAGDGPDMQALGGLAERIIATVEEPVEIDGSEYFVTTSIGIACFPADGGDAETLVKHADVAMYRAKDRGRNTYQFFTPALNATLRTRLSQEKTLRKALDAGEFVVYYQPQHDLVSGSIVCVEALVRWNHPRSGLVLPGQFIPNAELSGLIVALGDFILETACSDVSALRRTIAPDLRLAVNLSARQFHQQRLAAKVRACVERAALEPTALELEITESVAMNDAALTVSIMRELGAEGMRLSVDDFGTGYSSLGYLRRFPLDSIKIDRSFVTDLAEEPDDATIVRTVIAMAHALDLEVVAEGVETGEQLAFLTAERCDRVQGFFYSQAIPLTSLRSYISQSGERVAAG